MTSVQWRTHNCSIAYKCKIKIKLRFSREFKLQLTYTWTDVDFITQCKKNRYLFQRKSMRSFIFISCIPISIEKIASIKRHGTKKAIPKFTFLHHIEKHSKTIRLSFCRGLLLCPRKQSLKVTKQNSLALSSYRCQTIRIRIKKVIIVQIVQILVSYK